MNQTVFNQNLFSFLSSSPTPFHAVAGIESLLKEHNFHHLKENRTWKLEKGGSYFLTKDSGAIIAFILGTEEEPADGFRMLGAHTDSPCLQLKPLPDLKQGSYHQLGVEVYGGPLLGTWFDRNLSLAGRIIGETASGHLTELLIDFSRPLLTIPSIAIHFNRDANNGNSIDKQKHLPPIIAESVEQQLPDLNSLLLKQLQLEHPLVKIKEILSFDLFCYDFQGPAYVGIDNDYITSSRLDNLLSCHTAMIALAKADRSKNAMLFCANHEENGSISSTGAHGSFIDSVFERLIPDPESKRISLANSFLISMDNAHAGHPNFMDKMDPSHEIHLNQGPVIKINANQRYATNSLTAAIYKKICKQANICPQEFVMRSDLPCGSTIGPITAARLGTRTIDIGAPTLAMHSIRELTGKKDPFLLFTTIAQFLKSDTHKQLLDR